MIQIISYCINLEIIITREGVKTTFLRVITTYVGISCHLNTSEMSDGNEGHFQIALPILQTL